MSFRKPDGPLTVHVPSAREDRPSWWGVATIAVVGFAVGVAWPRLAGVRLGPSVPDGPAASSGAAEPPAPAASVASTSPSSSGAVPVAMPVPATRGGAEPSPAASGASRVSVAHGAVFACKTTGGESLKGTDCGTLPALDPVVQSRLHKLADCPEAASTNGRLHLIVRADFAHDALTVDLARDKGVSDAEPLLACARTALASANLQSVAHENTRYSVAYTVTFGSGGAAPVATPTPEPSAPPAPATEGTAQVEWPVAIVRDAPKTSGKVLARLQHGAALRVGTPKDGWYPVKYGDGFASDGWVYRGAIGR